MCGFPAGLETFSQLVGRDENGTVSPGLISSGQSALPNGNRMRIAGMLGMRGIPAGQCSLAKGQVGLHESSQVPAFRARKALQLFLACLYTGQ